MFFSVRGFARGGGGGGLSLGGEIPGFPPSVSNPDYTEDDAGLFLDGLIPCKHFKVGAGISRNCTAIDRRHIVFRKASATTI